MKQRKTKRLYKQIIPFLQPFAFVDVGARAIKRNRFVDSFPQAQYAGFELDAEECNRLNSLNIKRHHFYSQALGRRSEKRTLYVTGNPACSSLYEPNSQEMQRFLECGPYFEVVGKQAVQTVGLDDWYQEAGIPEPVFLELDTQGAELDILQGGEHLLAKSILGMQIEVEFFPLYKEQPLFTDVDQFVRLRGFRLFDLSRYRLRRNYIKTRGQLLWGHAFYLKDIYQMEKCHSAHFLNLAAIASYFGFEDYALEVLVFLIDNAPQIDSDKSTKQIRPIVDAYTDVKPSQKYFQRLRKKEDSWRTAPRKDRGYFLKD